MHEVQQLLQLTGEFHSDTPDSLLDIYTSQVWYKYLHFHMVGDR